MPVVPSEADVVARVETILKQMSLEEKIGQLAQIGGASFVQGPKPEEVIRKGGAGSVLWLNDTKKFNELQKIAVEESPSKIPLLFALDVIHGYRTIFPVPLGMASSWDPSVVERAQTAAAREARAAGLHWTFGPMVDIARDARWGRIVEGAGEDPFLGDVNPGGKLPVAFPRKGSHAPLYYARNLTHSPEGSPMYNPRYWDGLPTPLYPFGFGLSYTTFSITNLQVSAPQVKVGDSVTVTVDVTNTGTVVGDEVVQLYIHQKAGSDSRPMRELKGFERITLNPGETKTVAFQLGPAELGYWSTNAGKWIQDAGSFDLWAGVDSMATLHAQLTVIR